MAPAQQHAESSATSRDNLGRFRLGNHFGKGNPHSKRLSELRAVLLGRLSDDDLRDILDRLIKQARAGDTIAAKIILRYLGDPRRFYDTNVALIPKAPRRIVAGDPILDRMAAGLV